MKIMKLHIIHFEYQIDIYVYLLLSSINLLKKQYEILRIWQKKYTRGTEFLDHTSICLNCVH